MNPGDFSTPPSDSTSDEIAEHTRRLVPPFLFDAVVAHLPLGLAVLTNELRYLFVNDWLARINGIPAAAHVGRTVAEVVPALAEQAETLFRPVFTSGQPVLNLELRGETLAEPGVQRIWREHVYPLHDASGEVAAIGVVVEDVTALRQAEAKQAEALLEAERQRAVAERFVQIRDQVLAVVAHDLKGGLTIIQGQAQIAQRLLTRDELDLTAVDARLAAIVHSVGKIDHLTDELLDAAKLREGRSLELHREPADLVNIVQGCVHEQQQLVATREFSFNVEVDSCPVSIDVPRIERVVENLLTNAVKYSPVGTEITVTVTSAQSDEGRYAVLSVADWGIGIPPTDLVRVTEGFHRAGNVPSHIPGTGLGLMSVAGIVSAHGGMLTITSTQGQGTTVIVKLPMAE